MKMAGPIWDELTKCRTIQTTMPSDARVAFVSGVVAALEWVVGEVEEKPSEIADSSNGEDI